MVTTSSWEKLYKEKGYFIKYPDEHLIRFMARYFYHIEDKQKIKVLDAGCGIGRNTIYLAREGFHSFGVDVSPSGISVAKETALKNSLEMEFVVSPLKNLPFPDDYFDAVVDVQVVQQNNWEDICQISSEIKRVLKINGYHFSMMGTTRDSFCGKFPQLEKNTFMIPDEHTFKGVTHFFDLDEIKIVFKNFKIISIEKTETTFDNRDKLSSYWLTTAQKTNCNKPG